MHFIFLNLSKSKVNRQNLEKLHDNNPKYTEKIFNVNFILIYFESSFSKYFYILNIASQENFTRRRQWFRCKWPLNQLVYSQISFN